MRKSSSKKLVALLLAVMFVFTMVPFGASAAMTNSFKVTALPGYEYTLFKVASLDSVTGEYVPVAAAGTNIYNDIMESTESTAKLYQDLDKIAEADLGSYGTVVETFTFGNDAKSFNNLDDGIYYLRSTGTLPVTAEKIQRNSIIVLPIDSTEANIDISNKIKELGQVTVHKNFAEEATNVAGEVVYNALPETKKTAGSLDTITYMLSADITGSNDNHLKKYIIGDIMDDELDSSAVEIKSVTLKSDTNGEVALSNGQYTKLDDFKGYTFAVSFKPVLAGEKLSGDKTFYDFKTVEVVFTTKLTKSATPDRDIPNTDKLIYSNTNTSESQPEDGDTVKDGDEVDVKGIKIHVVKKDADKVTTLAGAEYDLYTPNDKGKIGTKVEGVKAVSGANGIAEFKFDNGKYFLAKDGDKFWVVETKAPDGYTLNTTPFEITVGSTGQTSESVQYNTKIKLPETGGAGTMMFTIVGASLILVAGALFVVVLKKRSAK